MWTWAEEEVGAGARHVDDGGVRARFEVRKRELRQEHRPSQVHGERFFPSLEGDLAEGHGERGGGVVVEDVDTAEMIDRFVHEAVELIDLAHVRRDRDRLAALLLDYPNRLLAGFDLPAGDHDLGAGECKRLCEGAPDAAAAARHDGDASIEAKELVELLLVHEVSQGGARFRGCSLDHPLGHRRQPALPGPTGRRWTGQVGDPRTDAILGWPGRQNGGRPLHWAKSCGGPWEARGPRSMGTSHQGPPTGFELQGDRKFEPRCAREKMHYD